MICAALTPVYLAFKSEIWRFLQPLINLMVSHSNLIVQMATAKPQ